MFLESKDEAGTANTCAMDGLDATQIIAATRSARLVRRWPRSRLAGNIGLTIMPWSPTPALA